jgi:hypothetical protein
MMGLLQEALVETDDAICIARGNGTSQQLRPRLASVRIWLVQPGRKGGIQLMTPL